VNDGLQNDLKLKFQAQRYGPYSEPLRHLLNQLDGSYLSCDKRLSDASPADEVRFRRSQEEVVDTYLKTEAKEVLPTLGRLHDFINGFESPIGLEALATVDWLVKEENVNPELPEIRQGIANWPHGAEAGARKNRIFSDRLLSCAIQRVTATAQMS
jgi:hypothetical protein